MYVHVYEIEKEGKIRILYLLQSFQQGVTIHMRTTESTNWSMVEDGSKPIFTACVQVYFSFILCVLFQWVSSLVTLHILR